jgi:hypothetical protein
MSVWRVSMGVIWSKKRWAAKPTFSTARGPQNV